MCPFIDKCADYLKVSFKPLSISGCPSSFFPLMCPNFPQMIQGVSLSRALRKHSPCSFWEMLDKQVSTSIHVSSSLSMEQWRGLNSQPLEYLNLSVTYLLCPWVSRGSCQFSSKSKHIKATLLRLWVHNELNHFQNCFLWVFDFLSTLLWTFCNFQWVKYQVYKPATCQHY